MTSLRYLSFPYYLYSSARFSRAILKSDFLTCSMCSPDCGDGENTNWRAWHQAEAKTWKKKKAEEKSPACEMFHVEHELTLKFNFSK